MVAESLPVCLLVEVYFARLLFVAYRAYVSLDAYNPTMIAYAWNDCQLLDMGFVVGDKQIKSIFARVGSETILVRLWSLHVIASTNFFVMSEW